MTRTLLRLQNGPGIGYLGYCKPVLDNEGHTVWRFHRQLSHRHTAKQLYVLYGLRPADPLWRDVNDRRLVLEELIALEALEDGERDEVVLSIVTRPELYTIEEV